MVDRDKVEGLIRHQQQYTAYLKEILEQDQEEFTRDPRSIGSARYYLQVAIETCINITNHIIAAERLRAPKDYKDSFQVLNEAGILPDDLTRTMRELAGLRTFLFTSTGMWMTEWSMKGYILNWVTSRPLWTISWPIWSELPLESDGSQAACRAG